MCQAKFGTEYSDDIRNVLQTIVFNPLKNINGFVFVSHFSEKKHIEHNEGFNNAIEMVIYNYTKPLLKPCKKEKKDYFYIMVVCLLRKEFLHYLRFCQTS